MRHIPAHGNMSGNKAKRNYYDKGVNCSGWMKPVSEFGVYDYDNYRYYAGPVLGR